MDQKKSVIGKGVHRKMGFTTPCGSILLICSVFLATVVFIAGGVSFLAPFGFIWFVSIKYRRAAAGLCCVMGL